MLPNHQDGAAAKPDETYAVKCTLPGAGCDGAARGAGAASLVRGAQAGTVSGLAPGTAYQCFVLASNTAGSTCSSPLDETTQSVPVAPSALAAPFVNKTVARVSWSDGALSVPQQQFDVRCVLPGTGCAGQAQGSVPIGLARGVQAAAVSGLLPGTGEWARGGCSFRDGMRAARRRVEA